MKGFETKRIKTNTILSWLHALQNNGPFTYWRAVLARDTWRLLRASCSVLDKVVTAPSAAHLQPGSMALNCEMVALAAASWSSWVIDSMASFTVVLSGTALRASCCLSRRPTDGARQTHPKDTATPFIASVFSFQLGKLEEKVLQATV